MNDREFNNLKATSQYLNRPRRTMLEVQADIDIFLQRVLDTPERYGSDPVLIKRIKDRLDKK